MAADMKKINWYFHVYTKVYMCTKFQLSKLIFVFIYWYQLLTADDRRYDKKLTEIFMCTIKFLCVLNFSHLGWILFSSTFISCHQLLTAVDSWWQLIWKNFDWNLYLHTKVDICAKFQLSSLIFIFISCQQLLQKKIKWNFHLLPKCDVCAKVELCRLPGDPARECDAAQTDAYTDV